MAVEILAPAYGGTEVLETRVFPTPEPAPGEILVEVRAIGANPADWRRYSGEMGSDPAALPIKLGFEAAGVVAGLGEGVSAYAIGDEVAVGAPGGAYATHVTVPAHNAWRKPSNTSFEAASGLRAAGGTAAHLLAATNVGPGDVVLVHGGAGAVGSIVLQLVRALGARAVATASPARHEHVRKHGAEPVAYGPGLLDRLAPFGPFDAALDLAGTDEAVDSSLALVADRGRIATILAFSRAARDGFKALGHAPGADPGTGIRLASIPVLAELVEHGLLEIAVDRTYPLAEAGKAHEYLKTGHARGKVVLLP
ncbi:NADP-dependent oxidoreductase [Segniliparus rugosus]|uniref:Enoyl reductase (ER) domain-containing protein n=1 Tax=Segniliparus rugosus (strain ATCC BAA-974 / DSM 45345 / CCUG 50838 / CIP 108380 / JCM 13579 / CDC 945) TaxID=679197 RepID=E5XTM2_SEGRC|nr:NADP-dependent oxidoreductase [Segniliparus rugosus]EFV12284.2 hypothetical protein HMPREF9336_02844 [Segniliparus rugosus ATCC BAA-974]